MPRRPPTRLLLVQGANMRSLGLRSPEIYGTTTANELDALLLSHAMRHGYQLDIFYADTESEAISRLSSPVDPPFDGLLMNPAGFSEDGIRLAQHLDTLNVPYVEIHLTNLEKRGLHSVMAGRANGVVMGFGTYSYLAGLEALLNLVGYDTPSH